MSPLRQWRESLGYTQRQAAAALGMTLKAYWELERGVSYDSGKPVEANRRTMLACSAITYGLEPWGVDDGHR